MAKASEVLKEEKEFNIRFVASSPAAIPFQLCSLSASLRLADVTAARMSVQRQLREDWDNREYEQIVADNVKNIANFLSSFELSCRSKLASLSDKLNLLEKKVEFLEARRLCRNRSLCLDDSNRSMYTYVDS